MSDHPPIRSSHDDSVAAQPRHTGATPPRDPAWPKVECEAEEPISGVQCERPEGHDGAHIFVTAHTVIAWGWPS